MWVHLGPNIIQCHCWNARVMPEGADHRRSMPVPKQHQALVPSMFAPWIVAVHFSIGPAVCYVCCLMP